MDENCDDLIIAASEEHNDGSLLRKLLLAIVRQNPPFDAEGEKERVESALKALLGKAYVRNAAKTDIREALRYMAQEYINDRSGPAVSVGRDMYAWLDGPGRRTIKQLAEEASRRGRYPPDVRHLQNTFGKEIRKYCLSEIHRSDVPSSLHYQVLQQIEPILKGEGVAIDLESVFDE